MSQKEISDFNQQYTKGQSNIDNGSNSNFNFQVLVITICVIVSVLFAVIGIVVLCVKRRRLRLLREEFAAPE